MKLGRLIKGILSILAVIFILDKVFLESDLSLTTSNNEVGVNNNEIVYSDEDTKVIKAEENDTEKYVEYINDQPYAIELSENSINLNCFGSGNNASVDAEMVKSHMEVIATFSTDKVTKSKNLKVQPNEKAYIYVRTVYNSEEKPINEVNCDYTVNILAA